MNVYALLDKFFFVFHSSLILLILSGWLWRRTRRLNLLVILATAFSWFILGIWYGYGYCPSTDWHWEVRMKLGHSDMHSSYIGFLMESLTGLDIGQRFVDAFALLFLATAFTASAWTNLKDWQARGKGRSESESSSRQNQP